MQPDGANHYVQCWHRLEISHIHNEMYSCMQRLLACCITNQGLMSARFSFRWTLLAAQLLFESQSFREAATIYQHLGAYQEAAQALLMAGDLLPAGRSYEEGAQMYMDQVAREMGGEGQQGLGTTRADVAAAIQRKHAQQVTELVAKADRCRVEALRCYLEAAAAADEISSSSEGGAEDGVKKLGGGSRFAVNSGVVEVVRVLLENPDALEGHLLVKSIKDMELLTSGEAEPNEGTGSALAGEVQGVLRSELLLPAAKCLAAAARKLHTSAAAAASSSSSSGLPDQARVLRWLKAAYSYHLWMGDLEGCKMLLWQHQRLQLALGSDKLKGVEAAVAALEAAVVVASSGVSLQGPYPAALLGQAWGMLYARARYGGCVDLLKRQKEAWVSASKAGVNAP